MLGWLPRWARLASRAPGLANTALHAPGLAGLAKRLGVAEEEIVEQHGRIWMRRIPGHARCRAVFDQMSISIRSSAVL
jgi:hypothetical protein